MALSNYSPSGVIYLGQVPWNNSYKHVRLYGSRDSQNSDILSMCGIQSTGYSYIARNRTLKVSIPADRLYHVNYCAYRNPSIGSRWIYCFVTDVEYVNDNTTELTLETDVFQTFLYGVDWSLPACMIEREHTDDNDAMFTDEPAFDLVYTVTDETFKRFDVGYVVVMTCSKPEQGDGSIIDQFLNPSGYYAKPLDMSMYKGVPYGCQAYCFRMESAGGGYVTDQLEMLLNGLQWSGSIDSVAAIFTVPSFFSLPNDGPITSPTAQFQSAIAIESFDAPSWVSGNGYTPRNRKLYRYPYTYLNLTDMNGSSSELRYELCDDATPEIKINAWVNPACQCIAYVKGYMGLDANLSTGIVAQMGALGSWPSNAYQTWVGQNGLSTTIAAVTAGVAFAGVTGGTSIAAAAANLGERAALREMGLTAMGGIAGKEAAKNIAGVAALGAAGTAGAMATQHASHYKQPVTSRGNLNANTLYQTGLQGIYAQRIQCVPQIMRQLDDFFDMFGYAVNKVKVPNMAGRDGYNYVKTVNAAPKSLRATAGSVVTDGGRGTPAAELSVIEACLNAGITFWHTTSDFGNFKLGD